MKKNNYIVFSLNIFRGKSVVINTPIKAYCKLFAIIRWKRNHKQRYLACIRGN